MGVEPTYFGTTSRRISMSATATATPVGFEPYISALKGQRTKPVIRWSQLRVTLRFSTCTWYVLSQSARVIKVTTLQLPTVPSTTFSASCKCYLLRTDRENRTPNFFLVREALSQLSYVGMLMSVDSNHNFREYIGVQRQP